MTINDKFGDPINLTTVIDIAEYQRAICGLIGIEWDDVFGETAVNDLPYNLETFLDRVNKYKDDRGLNPLKNSKQ